MQSFSLLIGRWLQRFPNLHTAVKAAYTARLVAATPASTPFGFKFVGSCLSDSSTFWEALASHPPRYAPGQWPVVSENWKNYIGVDVAHPEKAIDRIRDESDLLERVSVLGRAWALEHYLPKTVARRVLHSAGFDNPATASA